MRVLVACEESGTVREAFRERGHNAWSCDLLPARDGSKFHFQGDILSILPAGNVYQNMLLEDQAINWDLMLAFPPCTHLCVSGARWFKDKQKEQAEAVEFFMALINAPIPKIAVENPIGIMSSRYRKPDQIIQPWQFGHGETKATCLWTKNLPKLVPTNVVEGREGKAWKMAPGPNRARDRSVTYQGIADAMADQWGKLE